MKNKIQIWKILMMHSKLFSKDNSLRQLQEQPLLSMQVELMQKNFQIFHLNLIMFSKTTIQILQPRIRAKLLKMKKHLDQLTKFLKIIKMIFRKYSISSHANPEMFKTTEKMLPFRSMSYLSFSEKQICQNPRLMTFSWKILFTLLKNIITHAQL